MPPTYTFNPSTGVLTLSGNWGPKKLKKLITSLGVNAIKEIIIEDYARVSMESETFTDTHILVKRNGMLLAAYSFLMNIESYGHVRIRRTTIVDLVNDGQFYMTAYSRGRHVKNWRHLNLSQSFMYDMGCGEHSSVKATNSWIVSCTAHKDAQLALGTSIVINGTGMFSYWSRPSLGVAGFTRFIPEMQLKLLVIDILAQVDYINSVNPCPPTLIRKYEMAAVLLDNNTQLTFDLAKEFTSRVMLPNLLHKGKKVVAFNPTHANDNLRRYAGTHTVVQF